MDEEVRKSLANSKGLFHLPSSKWLLDEEVRKSLAKAERKLASAHYLFGGKFWDDAVSRVLH